MKTAFYMGLAAAAGLLVIPATSQVVVSEINFSAQIAGDDQWVEVVNLGGSKAELDGWSLYLATDTPGVPGNYWFGFPQGTELEAGEFLRVHWGAPIPDEAPTGPELEIFTGTTLFNFLFGFGFEPLSVQGGALALLSTQNNLLMNDDTVIQDWVSWGGNDYPREDLAIQAGEWTTGTSVTPSQQLDSIALNLALNQVPTPVSAYFHDASPTSNAPNAVGGSTGTLGTSCASGGGSSLSLVVESFPVLGNRDFRYRLDNTLGMPMDFAILVLSPDAGDGSSTILGCPIFVGQTSAFGALVIPTEIGQTHFPIDLSSAPTILAGIDIYAQAAVITVGAPTDLGTSEAIKITLGS